MLKRTSHTVQNTSHHACGHLFLYNGECSHHCCCCQVYQTYNEARCSRILHSYKCKSRFTKAYNRCKNRVTVENRILSYCFFVKHDAAMFCMPSDATTMETLCESLPSCVAAKHYASAFYISVLAAKHVNSAFMCRSQACTMHSILCSSNVSSYPQRMIMTRTSASI